MEKAVTLTEILPAVRRLSTQEKIRLIRILVEELHQEENIYPLEPYKVYYLSTPYGTFGAGRTLMDAMEKARSDSD